MRVFVQNWDRSIEFYENTLGLECVFKDADMGWGQFKVGGSHIGIERVTDDSEMASLVGRYVGVSLMVQDIDQTYERLLARDVQFTGPPEKQHWGGTFAHMQDPDGNVLTLLGQ